MSLFASIHTSFPKPPAEIQNDQAAVMKWFQSPEIRALAQKVRGYQLHEDKDGSWSADEVPPGQYVISGGVMSPQPTPNTKLLVAERPVTVPDGTDPMDLGEVARNRRPEGRGWVGYTGRAALARAPLFF
jgi:hypothetical protein